MGTQGRKLLEEFGININELITMLQKAYADEFRHAGLVADRIIQLGAQPLLEPKEWMNYTMCGYDRPDNPDVRVLLIQNIKSEQCAIRVYKNLMDFTKDKDPVTYDMALQILEDEIMHEEDLETIQNDIHVMEAKLQR